MHTVKVAVIGAGSWGRNLVRNFNELGALHALCDSNDAVIAELGRLYPSIPRTTDYRSILEDDAVRGVVISTPASTHFSLAREALLSGKDVFVEKPLALDVDEAYELRDIAAGKGGVLMVGHLLQYHSAFVKLKELVLQGELGRINYVYSNRLSFGKIRREEDIMWSFAPHDISMILSLAREVPESVMATGGNYLHKKIADVTTTHLDFPSGLKAHVFVSWLHPFKEQMLVVVGDKNMAVFRDTAQWEEKLLLYPHDIHWEGGVPVPDRKEAVAVRVETIEPLKAECRHFLECIASRRTPVTDAEEGIAVLRVLKAGQESLNAGGKRVFLAQEGRGPSGIMVHESSYVDQDVTIGEGTRIWHFCHILKGSRIGRGCSIGQNVVIGPDVTIGNNCKIQNNVSVYKGVTLEDDVFCGPSMVFTNVFNPRAHIPRMDELRPTVVKRGATIGANATIVCGHTIGAYAFIGAGSTVTRGAPDHALMVGCPARQIGWVCECGNRLDDALSCSHCGKVYERDERGLRLRA
ncbi:MAG TPA: Gfo/Idh/MocA family oxidoreductase [Deltaproteobacteria bacterium]|nr:Gfo/Idh/MocA family oxidoreductase [Deltaproteobacteria bacterium]HOM28689.1 Gfo/Idh/MocA family oxidoreductase [Deltaproteobacteria bacterium]HPP79631.1 Gfo/Idh/MocA family oxidoreductase [Deltaproteobacteria bacterium]